MKTNYKPNRNRYVRTTKTEGWIKIRYTPKELKYRSDTDKT